MPFADTTMIPFDEAADIVTTSYESFSPTLTTIVKSFFADRRIDVPVVKEKRSGAFNSSHVLPGGKPVSYTLMNYLGSQQRRDDAGARTRPRRARHPRRRSAGPVDVPRADCLLRNGVRIR